MPRLGIGVRAFEERPGVKKWVPHGFLDPEREQGPNLDPAEDLCERLGLRLTISRAANTADAPASFGPGLADFPTIFDLTGAPGADLRAPARPLPDGPFFLRVPDEHRASLCAACVLADRDHAAATGCLVMAEDHDGRVTIGRWRDPPRPDWVDLAIFGGPATDQRNETTLRRVPAVTWSGITLPDSDRGIAPGQKACALAMARRNLKAVEDLFAKD